MRFGESKKQIPEPIVRKVSETVPIVNDNIGNESEEKVEYTSQAFSMGRHPMGGFAVFTVSFNPVTLHAKVTNVERTGDSRDDSEYKLKIALGNYFAQQESKS